MQWTVDNLLTLIDFFVGVVEADQPSFRAAVEGS